MGIASPFVVCKQLREGLLRLDLACKHKDQGNGLRTMSELPHLFTHLQQTAPLDKCKRNRGVRNSRAPSLTEVRGSPYKGEPQELEQSGSFLSNATTTASASTSPTTSPIRDMNSRNDLDQEVHNRLRSQDVPPSAINSDRDNQRFSRDPRGILAGGGVLDRPGVRRYRNPSFGSGTPYSHIPLYSPAVSSYHGPIVYTGAPSMEAMAPSHASSQYMSAPAGYYHQETTYPAVPYQPHTSYLHHSPAGHSMMSHEEIQGVQGGGPAYLNTGQAIYPSYSTSNLPSGQSEIVYGNYDDVAPASSQVASSGPTLVEGYPTYNPGAPIQTQKDGQIITCGPEGCNLFVFHIPNDMSNMDLYHLFSVYGTVVSVRIMVEKANGRSRGFGFVSFETKEAAELAIEMMDGYQVGHKRLKVQHKKRTNSGSEGGDTEAESTSATPADSPALTSQTPKTTTRSPPPRIRGTAQPITGPTTRLPAPVVIGPHGQPVQGQRSSAIHPHASPHAGPRRNVPHSTAFGPQSGTPSMHASHHAEHTQSPGPYPQPRYLPAHSQPYPGGRHARYPGRGRARPPYIEYEPQQMAAGSYSCAGSEGYYYPPYHGYAPTQAGYSAGYAVDPKAAGGYGFAPVYEHSGHGYAYGRSGGYGGGHGGYAAGWKGRGRGGNGDVRRTSHPATRQEEGKRGDRSESAGSKTATEQMAQLKLAESTIGDEPVESGGQGEESGSRKVSASEEVETGAGEGEGDRKGRTGKGGEESGTPRRPAQVSTGTSPMSPEVQESLR